MNSNKPFAELDSKFEAIEPNESCLVIPCGGRLTFEQRDLFESFCKAAPKGAKLKICLKRDIDPKRDLFRQIFPGVIEVCIKQQDGTFLIKYYKFAEIGDPRCPPAIGNSNYDFCYIDGN